MRKSFVVLGLFFLCSSIALHSVENPKIIDHLSFRPANPQADSSFEVLYDARGTVLEDESEVVVAYYSYVQDTLIGHSIPMKKTADYWTAVMTPEKESISVGLKFFSGEITDSNNGLGYGIELCGADNKPLPGAKADLLNMQYNSAYYLGINRDLTFKKTLFDTLKNEFAIRPESKQKYLRSHYSLLKVLFKEEGEKEVTDDILKQSKKTDLKENELFVLYDNSKKYNLTDKMDEFKAKLKTVNPEHSIFIHEKYTKYNSIKDESEKMKFLSDMRKAYPDDWNVGYQQKLIALSFLENKQVDKAQEYIKLNPLVGDCCYYASGAEEVIKAGLDINLALEMAKKSVEIMRNNLKSQKDKNKLYMTEYDWQKYQDGFLANHLNTLGDVLMKRGDFAEAVKAYQESASMKKFQNPETNEKYSDALVKNRDIEKAITEMAGFISSNNSTFKMEEIYIEAAVQAKRSKEEAEAELGKLRITAFDNYKKKLSKELLAIPAPGFILNDLEGKKVSLNEFSGKIIILDFWATWCGPCIVSFPTMQKLVDKYKDNTDVKFIFINSLDYDDKLVEKVKEFLADDNYRFYVLLDDRYYQTFHDYAIQGLPTKVIIDKTGKIRYMYAGWKDSEAKEMRMFEALIDLLK